tara:strand:+ start:5878 stop:6111 length:234 start_codon:yes stop_codon:yes gene_type:complete
VAKRDVLLLLKKNKIGFTYVRSKEVFFFTFFLSIEERNLSSGTRGGEVHSRHFTYHRERERERERERDDEREHPTPK